MKKQTSKDIFGQALLKLARQKPVEQITVKQIVETSGLSLQTFYNHFRSKEDLVLWMHRQGGEQMLARFGGRRYSFHELTMNNIRFYADNANYLRCNFGGGILNPYAEISAENACTFFTTLICRRHRLEKLPEELGFYLRMYVYTCLHVFAEWALKGQPMPEEQLAAYLEEGMPEKLKPYLLG